LTFDHSSRKKGLFSDDCENWVVGYRSMCVYDRTIFNPKSKYILLSLGKYNKWFFFFKVKGKTQNPTHVGTQTDIPYFTTKKV